jgi:hypothetical protein
MTVTALKKLYPAGKKVSDCLCKIGMFVNAAHVIWQGSLLNELRLELI